MANKANPCCSLLAVRAGQFREGEVSVVTGVVSSSLASFQNVGNFVKLGRRLTAAALSVLPAVEVQVGVLGLGRFLSGISPSILPSWMTLPETQASRRHRSQDYLHAHASHLDKVAGLYLVVTFYTTESKQNVFESDYIGDENDAKYNEKEDYSGYDGVKIKHGLSKRQSGNELDSEYSDVLYFSAVRWLSRAATLKRFWNLREEIKFFMESKRQNVDFLSNENWLNDLAFLTDITQHLSDLNLKLQGKSQLVNKLFEHICAFEKKLKLFQVQLRRAILTHFTCLATRKLEFPNLDCTKYGTSVQKLRDEFANRFPDFRQTEIRLKLFAQPFDLAVEDSPDDCQMELIELQADMDTKRKFSENSLLDFTNSVYVKSFPICPVMHKELPPFLVAPTAVSNFSPK
ncbi:general transcription factor II-I repeat domain-containing protein 2-like [Tachypleus tridentatus]|uniref:general transcription factor II-I repeat domain-containing protein 2-like n=1 Tax=Tachypleus tridentatus TaxID=6853 RepID=UPI003FCFBCA2